MTQTQEYWTNNQSYTPATSGLTLLLPTTVVILMITRIIVLVLRLVLCLLTPHTPHLLNLTAY